MTGAVILNLVDQFDRLRLAGKQMTEPLEALAQRVAERVVDLAVQALDVNALVRRVDLNALLDQIDFDAHVLAKIDVNALLTRVDVAALLARVDVNELLGRIDMDSLVEQTDLGAVIAKSSGGAASEALDAARSQAVGLDQFIDRWVQPALRRKHAAPSAPQVLLHDQAMS